MKLEACLAGNRSSGSGIDSATKKQDSIFACHVRRLDWNTHVKNAQEECHAFSRSREFLSLPLGNVFDTSPRCPRRELSCCGNLSRKECHRPNWPGDGDKLNTR